jgi:polysaccharide deacetylase 2 family uncharacterized protein YibQ
MGDALAVACRGERVRHPQLTLIIDHMGLNSSSRTNRITDIPAAIDQAIALAKYPNV